MIEVVILGAGKGTRMRSALPKVLHTLAGKPFIEHVIDNANLISAEKIHVVVGHGGDTVKSALSKFDHLNFVEQTEQLGTGHAVQQAAPELIDDSIVLILYGDVPLTTANTLQQLISCVGDSSMGLLTVELSDPNGYGRIVRDASEQISAIVEQKDANAEQLKITEVNTGVMAMKGAQLKRWLSRLSNDNAQGEYYLTDVIEMAVDDGLQVIACHPNEEKEVMGINDRRQQAQLEREYQRELADKLMEGGVALADPSRFDCRGELRLGNDCFIDVNCVFEGENSIGNNVTFEQNCRIKNAKIGDNVTIFANSVIEDAVVHANCNIGPFARLRPGTELSEGAKIGNFVETKNAKIGLGSKVNHLSYVGDAELGKNVNIGAGTITCNYDGVNKHKTIIEDEVFVGSNSALVAPVCLGKGSTIAAGSTINSNVEEDSLAVARTRQRSIQGWQRPTKKNK